MTSSVQGTLSIASNKPFDCHSRLWLLLSYKILKRLQNPENDSSEDIEVDNHLDKTHFADPLKDAKSVAGFSVSHQFPVVR